jgi:hypothetical protein
MCVCVCVSMHVSMYVCVCRYACTYVFMYICMYMCVCLYACIYVCMYVGLAHMIFIWVITQCLNILYKHAISIFFRKTELCYNGSQDSEEKMC